MITGFNTDIEFQGVTYHVQTEDKGLDTPLILSLVYDRGTILASKRSPYNDLLNNFNENELAERLQRQHKLICAAVRAGRIEDLKQMTQKEAAAKRKNSADTAEKAEAGQSSKRSSVSKVILPSAELENKPVEKLAEDIPAPQLLTDTKERIDVASYNLPAIEDAPARLNQSQSAIIGDEEVWEIPVSVLETLIVEEQPEEDAPILSAEAVAVVAEKSPENELRVELLNEISFKGGERKTLSVLVKNGSDENGLVGAHVMIKILGSSFRPLIFHAKTDSNGIAVVNLQLPGFTRGRAAVLIRAMSNGKEVEMRRSVSQE